MILSVHLEHVGYLQIYLTNFLRQNKYLKKKPSVYCFNYDALPLKTQQLKIKKKINKTKSQTNKNKLKKKQQQNCILQTSPKALTILTKDKRTTFSKTSCTRYELTGCGCNMVVSVTTQYVWPYHLPLWWIDCSAIKDDHVYLSWAQKLTNRI